MIDLVRNFKRLDKLLPQSVVLRIITLTTFSIALLILRLKVQNFESPTFRPEDNPAAFAGDLWTRVLTQNYLYVLNLWLLVAPDWLSFDWSFDSIQLVKGVSDFRVAFVVILYVILIAIVYSGFRKKFVWFKNIFRPFVNLNFIF